MEYHGVIVTGTSRAGKSTVSARLCEGSSKFQQVGAVTTRKPREDEQPSIYQYITREEHENLHRDGKLLIKAEYREELYGITHQSLRAVVDKKRVPVLILTPEAAKNLTEEENNERDEVWRFLTVFLDAPDSELNIRLEQMGEQTNSDVTRQRNIDRSYDRYCLYIIQNGDASIEDVTQLIHYLWDYRNIGGMVPKRIIELMIKCNGLMEKASLSNIQGASYDLILGDEYYQNGEIRGLSEPTPFIVMHPGDYVVASSEEVANLPRDIAGRFDLSVSLFCRGVILSNGPQIDPGFRGRLFCLLFNTSNEKVQLKRGAHFATIEFIKLLEPTVPYSGKYRDKLKLQDYLPKIVEASAINKLINDVENLKKEKWLTKILPIVISAVSFVLAALAVVLAIIWKGKP